MPYRCLHAEVEAVQERLGDAAIFDGKATKQPTRTTTLSIRRGNRRHD